MKKLIRWIGWLMIGTVISAFLFVIVASQFGWYFNFIPTGSMKPAFNPGGVVITRPASMEEVTIGDPILFRELNTEGKALICHRVADIKEIDGGLFFQTKGDANEYPDSDLVSSENFVGKTIFYIPQIGKIAYDTQLHQAPITFLGKEISTVFLIVLVSGMILIGNEIKDVWGWMSDPYAKKRQEMLEKRKERILERRRSFS